MYNIEKRASGYILTFSGVIDATEMERWYQDSKKQLAGDTSGAFGVIIDMKTLQPLSKEAKAIMVNGQTLYKNKGMKRSAVILSSAEICKKFRNLAVQSGIYVTERYLDSSTGGEYTQKAIAWVRDGADPDKPSV